MTRKGNTFELNLGLKSLIKVDVYRVISMQFEFSFRKLPQRYNNYTCPKSQLKNGIFKKFQYVDIEK